MALLSHDAFQPPLPSLLFLVPPASPFQWPLRIFLLFWTTFLSLPLFILLIPLSVILSTTSWARWAPLPLHPDNLPPHKSLLVASIRGIWMYYISASVWAITSLGNAPDKMGPEASRKLANYAMWTTNAIDRWVGYATPQEDTMLREERIPPTKRKWRVGVLAETKNVRDEPILGLWLLRKATSALDSSAAAPGQAKDHAERGKVRRRVYLFLSGGGYVTGAPIAHPFLFALARHFPLPSTTQDAMTPDHGIFAPNVHHSLSLDRSFPVPVLDALAAYAHLRSKGYSPCEIIIMGDSAGAGLVWSLVSSLTILKDMGQEELGVPGGMICCSPWWSLPPTSSAPTYPDLLDTPQLLQAARCYLGRYPLLKGRPNPFESDWTLWADWVAQSLLTAEQRLFTTLIGTLTGSQPARTPTSESRLVNQEAASLLDPKSPAWIPKTLEEWLAPEVFIRMTSHHPFISPVTDPSSPFVARVLDILAREGTRVLIHAGTAEWFYDGAISMYQQMKLSGVDVSLHREIGGYHSEPAYLPVGIWGHGRRWLDFMEAWARGEDIKDI